MLQEILEAILKGALIEWAMSGRSAIVRTPAEWQVQVEEFCARSSDR